MNQLKKAPFIVKDFRVHICQDFLYLCPEFSSFEGYEQLLIQQRPATPAIVGAIIALSYSV
jgi:hypothetical protein